MKRFLNHLGEKRIVGVAAVTRGVLAAGNAQTVMLTPVGAADVARLNLWNLERPQPHVAAELNNHVIAISGGGAGELVKLVIDEPNSCTGLLSRWLLSAWILLLTRLHNTSSFSIQRIG